VNFEFSAEQVQLREQVRRFLDQHSSSAAVRAVLDGPDPYDAGLWQGLAGMGLLGIVIPEAYGGLGLTYLELCVVAEELGRSLAPVPFSSTVYLAGEFLLAAGSEAQKRAWLPKIAGGEAIGCFALVEGPGPIGPSGVGARVAGGRLDGVKIPVADGDVADFAVVAAQAAEGLSLFLVDLNGAGVTRTQVATIDPSRSHARIDFEGAAAEPLGTAGGGWPIVEAVFDKAAVLTAFEQLGGADRALEMAVAYARERMAFGRPIGSFQAIKHMLADMYVSAALARSNCYYGAWALSTGAGELRQAAATARVSATQAYQHCARNDIQVHGGMGFTWDVDCHLHYRRSNLLALGLGSLSQWEDRLVESLRRAAA
jgi:alkylation response protein AidB-like acyl-CoA dehydrogenase